MKQQNIRIAQFVGLLGCLLVITSCCLFRTPKDPNQIQDPPPTDRNYLACRVNGKPVVFMRVSGPPFRKRYSSFHIEKDSVNKTTIVSLFLDGDNSSAFDTSVNLWLTQKFQFQKISMILTWHPLKSNPLQMPTSSHMNLCSTNYLM